MLDLIQDALLTFKGIIRYYSLLKKSQFWNSEQKLSYQKKHLSILLKHAFRNVPWYSNIQKKYDIRPNSINPFNELKKLPILSKSDVRNNHADFCVPHASKNSLTFSTSGTTGEPLSVYTSKNQWILEQGIIWRSWKWAGYRFRDKVAIFRSYAPGKDKTKIKKDFLRNWSYFSVFDMDDESMDKYFDYLIKWKPKFLRGYPSALLLVAEYALKNNVKLPHLKGIFTASEVVHDIQRDKLKEAFGVNVFDHYGQAEITCMFHECEIHEGMHIDSEYGYVELLPSSSEGLYKIIATNLHNLSMPLLRYDTGDLSDGTFIECGCKKGLKLKKIHGRNDDYIIKKDNSKISTINLYTYFAKLDYINKFQMQQNSKGTLEIILKFDSNIDKPNQDIKKEFIKSDLSEKTGLDIIISSEKSLYQSSEGKLPSFIQNIRS
jgi:phenylacetate-CoA ligase